MKKILIAACCAGLIGGVSVASAQTMGPSGQQNMQSNDGMGSNAQMMKKKKMKKKGMMKKGGMMNDGMSGGGMQGGGMSGGMQKKGM